jgi:hypothetical protein
MSPSLSKGVRRAGWVLAITMLLYPVDMAHSWWVLRPFRAAEPPAVATSGMQFELRSMAIHCGPVGWVGAWAWLFGLVWLAVSGALCLARHRSDGRMEPSTRRVLLSVAASLCLVLACMAAEGHVFA